MQIKLLNWENEETYVEIDLDRVAIMNIRLVSGDEVLHVIYKDYREEDYDSCDSRIEDYEDGFCEIYDFRKDRNVLFSDVFQNRTNSNWMWETKAEDF